jgi:transcriptional regulator NrdR family protein
MRCPQCFCPHTRVTHTYKNDFHYGGKLYSFVRRRRQCRHCKYVFHTSEKEDYEDNKPDETPPNKERRK